MAEIRGHDGETKFQRRNADEQIAERDGYTLGLLLTVDFSGKQSSRSGVRIDSQIAE